MVYTGSNEQASDELVEKAKSDAWGTEDDPRRLVFGLYSFADHPEKGVEVYLNGSKAHFGSVAEGMDAIFTSVFGKKKPMSKKEILQRMHTLN